MSDNPFQPLSSISATENSIEIEHVYVIVKVKGQEDPLSYVIDDEGFNQFLMDSIAEQNK